MRKLEARYAGKSTVNKLGTFNLFLNTKLKGSASIGDHILTLESYFSRLTSMRSETEGPLKGFIFLSSLSEKVESCAMIASVHTMPDGQAIYNHVMMLFLQEYERIS